MAVGRLSVIIAGTLLYLGRYNLPQEVNELEERQYTASKEQAHVTTKLTCKKMAETILTQIQGRSNHQSRLRSVAIGAREFSKRSFIFKVRPTFHTNPLRKQSYLKTLVKPEEIQNTRFLISCGQKIF